jgi:ribosomal protein S18 acetylase RimI-like enzyme
MTETAAAAQALTIRPLTRDDLAAVVAIDAALEGRWRRNYVERRLAAALREPALHAQFAACDGKGLAGYILARVLEGEFGRTEPALRLEMIGMRTDARGHHGGARLFQALSDWARRHGIRDVRTSAGWRDAQMLHWLDSMGFRLAPKFILDAAMDDVAQPPGAEAAVTVPAGHGPGNEVNFGAGEANDNERLARDQPEVRAMRPEDLREIVRIDHAITGRDRSGYIGARLVEAMGDSPIRVSLAARLDDAIVGFVMARADLGDFGRAEPVAVIDTIGIDPEYTHRGAGHALLTQLFANLGALQVERVETVVASTDLALLGFFQRVGLRPSQRLAFVRRLDRA